MKSLILIGDARKRLAELPAGVARTCITSPPYFGLRDYGTAEWQGGDASCDHTISNADADNMKLTGDKGVGLERVTRGKRDACIRCGATRIDSQIGLEETPDDYVREMVTLFREVHRVLSDDGTLWLNLGDSYAGNNSRSSNNGRAGYGNDREGVFSRGGDGLKTKDLIGIPWRVALALQADGWYLRQDIIWAKPNPMPESVQDRCTKSHEYVFLLSKQPRYYYDHVAIREPVATSTAERVRRGVSANYKYVNGTHGQAKQTIAQPREHDADRDVPETRNRRDVWMIATRPFKGAHFAVMPETLVEPCILAGSQAGDTVLDPFTGSGTVAVVANRYGRNYVGTELNPEYAEIARERITGDSPLLNEVEVQA